MAFFSFALQYCGVWSLVVLLGDFKYSNPSKKIAEPWDNVKYISNTDVLWV